LYVALMVCEPEASVEVVNFAKPPLSATVFRTVVPSSKVTVPVTVPTNWGFTLAVKVTDCPTLDGFKDEAKVVLVVALLTTWFTGFDVLPANIESPPYTAAIALVPTGRVEVVKLAEPPLNVPVPHTVLPVMNETVSPFGGAPRLEVTAAVKITFSP
jgi:hypothetical protein